jgi:glycosyltransferase involved in cell wall biosynthesis
MSRTLGAAGLRIVYLHRLEFSGSSQTIQVLRDYHALLGHGHEIELFYRAPEALAAEEIDSWLARHGLAGSAAFRLHCVAEGFAGKRRLARAAAELIDASERPVLVAVRTMDHARMALALRRRHGKGRVRVVIELHETALPHLVYGEQGRRWRAWLSRRTEASVLREVDGIIATVGSQMMLVSEHVPRHAPSVVLPNGVDLRAFAGPRPQPLADGCFHLRYAGQFLSWKGTDTMIQALAELPSDVVLDLAGGKPGAEQATRAALEALAGRSGVSSRVRYLGFLAPRDVPAFLMQADALLLPLGDNVQSRFFTSPMKLFEYAASGVPMVVARQPTTLSLLREGEQALLVAPGSARELGAAVARLRADPALARALAGRAAAWVAQYSYDQRALRYQRFLESVYGG